MSRKICIAVIFGLLSFFCVNAQDAHSYLRIADEAYENKEYEKASQYYEGALRKERSGQALYNKGNALFKMENYKEAADLYRQSIEVTDNDDLRFKNYHNQGNAFALEGDFEKAVEAYKNALKINPDDKGTKENLVRALRQMPPPPPKSEKEQQQKEGEEKKEQEEKGQKQDKDKDGEEEKESPASAGDRKEGLSPEEIERLLKAAEQEDRSVQKKLKKKKESQKARPVKDW